MNAVLMLPQTKFDETAPSRKLLPQRFGNQPILQDKPSGSRALASVLRAAILIVLGAGALTLLFFSLVPAILVGLLMFLPALAPLILVALAIVFTDDAERNRDKPAAAGEQPCSCHHDRLQRALQQG